MDVKKPELDIPRVARILNKVVPKKLSYIQVLTLEGLF